MGKFLKVLAISVGLIGFIGLGSAIASQAKLLTNICYNLVGHKFQKLGWKTSILTLFLEIKNPSAIDITIDSYKFNIFVDGKLASRLKGAKSQKIKRNGSSILKLTFSFSPKKIFETIPLEDIIKGVIFDESKTVIRVAGQIIVKHGVKFPAIDINIEKPLSEMLPSKDDKEEVC